MATEKFDMKRVSSISLEQLLQSYLESHVLRDASIRNYRQIVSTLQKDLHITCLHEAEEEIILRWRKAVLARSSAITWNNYHTHMRALFNFAVRENLITDNVFLKVTKVRAPKLRKKTIKLASIDLMMNTIEQNADKFDPPWFWITVIKVLFFTGMRQQQLLMLKWRDIDFDNREIFLTLEGSKTHREWTIPLPRGCRDALWNLKEQTQQATSNSNYEICILYLQTNLVFSVIVFNLISGLFVDIFGHWGIKGRARSVLGQHHDADVPYLVYHAP